jgi:hypothetical protein
MPFHLGLSYGIAIATAALLGLWAVHNRRSGWRREREDVVLKTLMMWAEAQSHTHTTYTQPVQSQVSETPLPLVSIQGAPAPLPVTPSILSDQLNALSVAVAAHGGKSQDRVTTEIEQPGPTPVQG